MTKLAAQPEQFQLAEGNRLDKLITPKDRFDDLLERVNADRPDKPLSPGELLQTLVENFTETARSKKGKPDRVS